jgi:hypothetical protein
MQNFSLNKECRRQQTLFQKVGLLVVFSSVSNDVLCSYTRKLLVDLIIVKPYSINFNLLWKNMTYDIM